MRLYAYWRSSASWRVRIGLAHKRVAYELSVVNLVKDGGEQHRDEFRALNPMSQVPTLVLDDGRVLSQSLAILEYLEEIVPEPPLLPRDPYARARARQLAELVNSGIQPLHNAGIQRDLRERGVDDKHWTQHYIGHGLDALEQSARATSGAFLVSDQLSIADLCLVPQLYAARRFSLDPARWPLLLRVEETCAALPAFQAAHADRQPDAIVK